MNVRVIMIVGALVVFSGTAAQGQAPAPPDPRLATRFVDPIAGLSLSDAITRALAQEPAMVAVRQQTDIARGERLQAGLRPNPTIGFEQRTEPQGTDSVSTVMVDWPLDLFRRSARTAVADARITVTTFGVADRERLLAGEVRERYGDVLVAVRDLEVLDAVIQAVTRQRDVLVARVDAGRAPPLERDRVQVEVQQLEGERLLQLGQVEAAVVALKRVLGMPAAAPLTVRDSLEALVLTEPPTGIRDPEGAAERADVREAEAQLAVADAAIEQADREGRLDMSLYGTYMRMDAGFPQMGFGAGGALERVRGVFHYVAGGVRLSLPLMNRNQGTVAKAQAERTAAQASLEAARLSADAELAAARAIHARARSAVAVYRDGLQALARQNVSTVQQTYDLGRLTLLDVLSEQRRYLEVERAYTLAMRAAFEARTAMLVAQGAVR